jgi:DNA-binding transcriptional LysR family regulator
MLDKLSEMRAFQAVADAGGFTAAAAELRVSQSLVSRAVARLEQRLGTTLLHRSTRRVSLTDEGVIFLQGCRRVLEDIGEVERSVTSSESPAGILRISASVLFGQDPIVPLLPEFMARYPKLEVQLSLADRHVDLIEEKIDIAIRLGRLASSSLIARKLGEQRRLIVASPAYLAQRGRPKTPDDLLKHNCLLWDEVSLLEASHRDEATPVHALYARTNIAKPRVRAFLDFLTEKFSLSSCKDAKPKSPSARKRNRQAMPTA